MPLSFFEIFPREIRDQIYTHILESRSGSVILAPWTLDVARSLSVLRVCRRMHRECKDIIWLHKGLVLREPTEIYKKFSKITNVRRDQLRTLTIDLEMLDRDELEWITSGLRSFQYFPQLECITIQSIWEIPRDLVEFRKTLDLQNSRECNDGRLFRMSKSTSAERHYTSGWPRFSHWGKQKWVRRMLQDPSGVDEVLMGLHEMFGGEVFVNEILCIKDKLQVAACDLDPGNGRIRIVPGRVFKG